MTTRLIALTLSALALTCGAAAAQNLDAASQEALGAVLKMLQDPAARAGAIAGSPQGSAADRQMRDLAGNNPAVTQELYELAAQVFEDVTRGSGGDVKAMSQAFSRGQSDPAGFASMLSPRTLERLRALSIKIGDQQRR